MNPRIIKKTYRHNRETIRVLITTITLALIFLLVMGIIGRIEVRTLEKLENNPVHVTGF